MAKNGHLPYQLILPKNIIIKSIFSLEIHFELLEIYKSFNTQNIKL